MNMLRSQLDRLLRSDPVIERLLEDRRLIPGEAIDSEIPDPRARGRKWELPQRRERARHHLGFSKAGKPQTQVETVSDAGFFYGGQSAFTKELLSCSAPELLSSAA